MNARVSAYTGPGTAAVYEDRDWEPLSPVPPPDWGDCVGYFWYTCDVVGPDGYSTHWSSGGRYPVYSGNTVTNMLTWEKSTGLTYFTKAGTYSATFSVVAEGIGLEAKVIASKQVAFYVW